MEKQKKKVLITMHSRTIPPGMQKYAILHHAYIDKANAFNFIPLLVSGTMQKDIIDELYALSDCVLFTGGVDINPELYNQMPHEKTEQSDPLRDALEIDILQRTLKDQKPFLGICRGAQMLAIACKGTLIQHLPDISDEEHAPKDIDLSLAENFQMPKHSVLIQSDTKARSIFRSDEILMPTAHHQAVDTCGDLVISGRSAAGIVEIIEHPHLPFHIGIQGHPEVTDDLDILFEAFHNAA